MPHEVIAATQQWLERAVIGLDLCPFAKTPHSRGQIRYVVSDATSVAHLLSDLDRELQWLVATPADEVETTLLIHPHVLADFLDYNDFLDDADALLARLGLEGVLQVASFHPAYRFADTSPDDVTNCTNRSPYPMLHLLREASVEKAVAAYPDTDQISRKNIDTMRRLGLAGWRALMSASSVD